MSTRTMLRSVAALLLLMIWCPLVLAQPGQRPGPPFGPNPNRFQPGQPVSQHNNGPDAAAACGGFLIFFLIMATIAIVSLIVWIFVAIWAAKDAKARGMDTPALWVVLILLTGLIGLIIYLVVRPSGDLKTCRECGSKRLRGSRRCPHCRAA